MFESTIAQEGIGAVPQDIIDCIIDEVANTRRDESDRQDLCNCSLVSPAFRNRSQSWLLEILKIKIYPTDTTRREINAWIHRTLGTNPRIASYVRSVSIIILTINHLEDTPRSVGAAGFSGPPLRLPNLSELEITANAHYNIPFSHLSVELETEFINLIQSPQLHSTLFTGIVPPTHITALYNLNYLEMREKYYFIRRPSLHDLRRPPSQNTETFKSLLCLCNDWKPEKVLFSEASGPLELSMKQLKGYAVFLTGPEKLGLVQTALSSTSESLCSFSITIGEINHGKHTFSTSTASAISYTSSVIDLNEFSMADLSHQVLDLKTLSNLSELEFIVDENEVFDITSTSVWPFIQNTLLTLPPSNNLTTLKLIFSGRGLHDSLTNKLAQFDDLLSNVSRFNMLREVFVSPLGDSKTLAKISRRGIAVNGADDHF